MTDLLERAVGVGLDVVGGGLADKDVGKEEIPDHPVRARKAAANQDRDVEKASGSGAARQRAHDVYHGGVANGLVAVAPTDPKISDAVHQPGDLSVDILPFRESR